MATKIVKWCTCEDRVVETTELSVSLERKWKEIIPEAELRLSSCEYDSHSLSLLETILYCGEKNSDFKIHCKSRNRLLSLTRLPDGKYFLDPERHIGGFSEEQLDKLDVKVMCRKIKLMHCGDRGFSALVVK